VAAQPPFGLRDKAAINRQLRRAVEDVVDVSVAWVIFHGFEFRAGLTSLGARTRL
jgi:hypothetical protein